MRILAARAGPVRVRESSLGEWQSAIEKHLLTSPARVTKEGLDGDEQADRKHHGGPDKAILAYSVAHYALWREELETAGMQPGDVGENFEVEGQQEADVAIGDIYQAGELLLQVSQPRQPCWKPARLNDVPNLTAKMAHTGRTGWYLRVLKEGVFEFPCDLLLVNRPNPAWTIARANRLLYQKAEDERARLELADLPELSTAWREMLRSRTPA